ncbi:MAG TPA: VF530 family protein [Opitutaceae bacterium]
MCGRRGAHGTVLPAKPGPSLAKAGHAGLRSRLSVNVPSNDPLHGLTLEFMLTRLVEQVGWKEMANAVDINCFKFEPSIKSSLHFLRRTPWARAKVEQLYLSRLA